MNWVNKKGIITALLIMTVLMAGIGVGYALMDGENPIKLGVTMWYLNDSGRDGLKIATDSEKHLVKLTPEQIARYIPQMSNTLRGEWVLNATNGSVLLFEDTDSEQKRTIEIVAKPFLSQYQIIQFLHH